VSKTEINNISRIRQGDDTANVLVVDNDPGATRFILEILARKGIRGYLANDEKSALDFLDKGSCDLVFTSERVLKRASAGRCPDKMCLGSQKSGRQDDPSALPESGFELLRKIRANSPELPVIMISQAESQKSQSWEKTIATAVKAVREGCCDFLIKPLNRGKIETLLDTFLPNHCVSTMASAQEDTHCLYRIVGRSTKLAQTVDLAARIAPTSAPVLISGESGTGKELISYLIHHKSKRAQGPYIKVNCAALSDSLLESELFGHEKGAFTGAYNQRKGRFEMAHGGTLLLDEITETPPRFQAKLLRVLEQQDFERVGGEKQVRVDVRIISTTNKNLLHEVQQGRFRQDLYYRLSGVRLVISPLRERNEDLPDLVWYFINLYAREAQRHITKLAPVMMEIFAKYRWPGNVRQLRNAVRTSLILGVGETLSLADVSWLLDETKACSDFAKRQADDLRLCGELTTDDRRLPIENSQSLGGVPLEQIERQAILDTLRQTAGNQTKAAKVLGISDRTLRDKVRRYRQQGCLQLA
jgi:DNA-binding NtrC family response regulator